jgi:hypothetical protein
VRAGGALEAAGAGRRMVAGGGVLGVRVKKVGRRHACYSDVAGHKFQLIVVSAGLLGS